MSNNKPQRIVVDVAGASVGGSGRFLSELDAYLPGCPFEESIQIIGRSRPLTPSWLLRREQLARGAKMRIALNNASFISTGGRNVVLLRNVLHFSNSAEFRMHNFVPSMELRSQIPIIRGAARRANRIVVPTTAMAERVIRHVPSLEKAIEVRGHPVSQKAWAGMPGMYEIGVLVPIIPSPYKHLDQHVDALVSATDGRYATAVPITVTAEKAELPIAAQHPRVRFIGRLSAAELEWYWQHSLAVYYPTTLEAFGYPMAEARVNGRYVIAQDTPHAREVAGSALCPFTLGDEASLAQAVDRAISSVPVPDGESNDPNGYFNWLFGGSDL